MARRQTRRGLVLGVSLLALLGSACTPDTAPPPPPPSTSATPTETAQEREERLAYASAEKSYLQFRAEFYRVLRAGGANGATEEMKKTAAGPYLKYFTSVVQAYKGEGTRSTGAERSGYVRPEGYSAESLLLNVCEDSRAVKDYNKAGKQVGKGQVRVAQLEVRRVGGIWKVWDGDGKEADSCG